MAGMQAAERIPPACELFPSRGLPPLAAALSDFLLSSRCAACFRPLLPPPPPPHHCHLGVCNGAVSYCTQLCHDSDLSIHLRSGECHLLALLANSPHLFSFSELDGSCDLRLALRLLLFHLDCNNLGDFSDMGSRRRSRIGGLLTNSAALLRSSNADERGCKNPAQFSDTNFQTGSIIGDLLSSSTILLGRKNADEQGCNNLAQFSDMGSQRRSRIGGILGNSTVLHRTNNAEDQSCNNSSQFSDMDFQTSSRTEGLLNNSATLLGRNNADEQGCNPNFTQISEMGSQRGSCVEDLVTKNTAPLRTNNADEQRSHGESSHCSNANWESVSNVDEGMQQDLALQIREAAKLILLARTLAKEYNVKHLSYDPAQELCVNSSIDEDVLCQVITNGVQVQVDEWNKPSIGVKGVIHWDDVLLGGRQKSRLLVGSAVYGPMLSWVNHSCRPNASYRFEFARCSQIFPQVNLKAPERSSELDCNGSSEFTQEICSMLEPTEHYVESLNLDQPGR